MSDEEVESWGARLDDPPCHVRVRRVNALADSLRRHGATEQTARSAAATHYPRRQGQADVSIASWLRCGATRRRTVARAGGGGADESLGHPARRRAGGGRRRQRSQLGGRA